MNHTHQVKEKGRHERHCETALVIEAIQKMRQSWIASTINGLAMTRREAQPQLSKVDGKLLGMSLRGAVAPWQSSLLFYLWWIDFGFLRLPIARSE
ncbi:hypothetical protein Trichorick_00083 [Candidatus Trichorickettsia mobilis]|uniref:Uncharacterized protein n=1 Tax=Candidatus Trichorickettsia mobilis TaxID=1346319 RepID=A0ABZ0URH3_9RICK|nr:hypothetical protein [Candidatus Trichorickettsia mobilis]WPY00211.1 hypothetical protein Trichorick_00083 [Candidatus Trichorickettsia mobilis]